MSLYQFIASEYKLPELVSPKIHRVGKSVIKVACEDDLGDLEIYYASGKTYYDIPYYTKLPFIYGVSLKYTEERMQRFYQYLTKYCKAGKKCEIWSIWLANDITDKTYQEDISRGLKNLRKKTVSLKELTIEDLSLVIYFINEVETPTPTGVEIY